MDARLDRFTEAWLRQQDADYRRHSAGWRHIRDGKLDFGAGDYKPDMPSVTRSSGRPKTQDDLLAVATMRARIMDICAPGFTFERLALAVAAGRPIGPRNYRDGSTVVSRFFDKDGTAKANSIMLRRAEYRVELARIIRALDGRPRAWRCHASAVRPPSRKLLAAALSCSTEAIRKLLGQSCDQAPHRVEAPPHRAEEKAMIQTDEEFALDAARLASVAARLDAEREEILRIAGRLQARFPANQVLSEAVERFIGAALDFEQAA